MNVCVFLGSSLPSDPSYLQLAREVGALLAKQGHRLVYGGAMRGTMNELSCAYYEAGGEKGIAVYPRFFESRLCPSQDELIPVDSLGERKEKMARFSEAFVVLPGGFGTLEEAADLLCWRAIGIAHGRMVFLNFRGFYDSLKAQIEKMGQLGYLHDGQGEGVYFIDSVEDLPSLL